MGYKCRSCGASIKWIRMTSGKAAPVDPYLRTIVINEGKESLITETGIVIRGRFASYDEGANASGYISHFATCPNAAAHRRRARA